MQQMVRDAVTLVEAGMEAVSLWLNNMQGEDTTHVRLVYTYFRTKQPANLQIVYRELPYSLGHSTNVKREQRVI